MTHDELCLRGNRWLQQQGFSVTLHDKFRAFTAYGEQPDVIGWRDSISCLIECKSSRADFHADKKKLFRESPEKGMGDWRFYLCPPGVVTIDDLPNGWGLLYCYPKTIKKVHGFPPNTIWVTDRPFDANKRSETMMLRSALRRFAVRGMLDTVYEPIANPTSEEE
ncbi:hypothetical protein [Marinobacter sp. Hex_13]|uniref:hypothetical protein n=1 Tax=Marinobacter sp. Hex_13 TaxID=1795866 RepID=UPI000799547C|nr:hypothetical protein [Marinobacter sp. Hex_13]KXJ45844.1 MAG: hypothetical protein AXW11_12190 [Marinobacter sp. Hex_13]